MSELTHKQMKRMEYCCLHPLFHPERRRTAVCHRCGKRKHLRMMREIGLDIYVCRDCNKKENAL